MTDIQFRAPTLPGQNQQVFENWGRIGTWIANNSFEIATAGGIVAAIVFLLLGLRALARRRLANEKAGGWGHVIADVIGRTKFYFILMLAVKLVSAQATLPSRIVTIINFLFVVATAFQVAIWARTFVLGLVEQRVGEGQEHRTLGTAIGLIRVLVTVTAFLIAGIVVLDNVGVNVTGLIAGLGVGGIAIGLAAQGIFSDLFAALAIIFDKPFRRGDVITVGNPPGGFTGTVENIGLKTTRIRALSGEIVAYGNADLLKNPLHNNAQFSRRRVRMMLGVTYETKPELLESIAEEVKAIVEAAELSTFDHCIAVNFGASSIDFELVFFVESAAFAPFADARQQVMFGILRRFAELGIAFAYPTQTTFTAAPDGTLIMPYAAPAESAEKSGPPAA